MTALRNMWAARLADLRAAGWPPAIADEVKKLPAEVPGVLHDHPTFRKSWFEFSRISSAGTMARDGHVRSPPRRDLGAHDVEPTPKRRRTSALNHTSVCASDVVIVSTIRTVASV